MSTITIQYDSRNFVAFAKDGSDKRVKSLAWQVSQHISKCEKIISDNHLHYLSNMEADSCLNDLYGALDVGGALEVNVPDFDHIVSLWQDASWKESDIRDPHSTASQSIKRIFGDQQDANPMFENYDSQLLNSFHSCYSIPRLKFLLERVGFTKVNITSDAGMLKAIAHKTMDKGERQISTSLKNVRPDHLNRYEFASGFIKNNLLSQDKGQLNILDLACGIGYGSWILATSLDAYVTSVDVAPEAIEYAKEYYSHSKIEYLCEDARTWYQVENQSFDVIVSFETIEHVTFDKWLLERYFQLLKPGGSLIVSTPNQDVMPFDKEKFRFHVKHYTNNELLALLNETGFSGISLFAQYDPVAGEVVEGDDGYFTVALARK